MIYAHRRKISGVVQENHKLEEKKTSKNNSRKKCRASMHNINKAVQKHQTEVEMTREIEREGVGIPLQSSNKEKLQR